MTTANGRNEFAPPPTPGFLRALGLAILAHGLLVAMLTVGVQWKRDATPSTFEAELWSAVPEQAAPPAPEPPPPSEPEPTLVPPAPVKPAPQPVAPPPPVVTPDADIALAKEKARVKKEKLLQQEKQEAEKQLKLRQDKLQKEKLEREKEKLDKAARDKKLQQEQREKDAKAANAAKQKTVEKTKEETKKLEELRQQNMKRLAGLAGNTPVSGNGDARSTGTAAQSSGPSAGYGGRIRARIKPNITYTETIVGNPMAEVEVRTSPDGTIISRKLVKASGVKSWDDAVLNAIDKTETLPRDTDGRVPASLVISFRPKD